LIGVGVAASLMAPLTAFVRLVEPSVQLRLNAWMLMTGSLGMVASTVPVQMLLPFTGWRGLFAAVGGLLLLAMAAIAWVAPRTAPRHAEDAVRLDYRGIVRHPAFVQAWPLGFFAYAGLIAMQSLWAGPWMTQVAGATADQAARGLFFINLSMLVSFFAWGVAMPRLVRRGITADRLIGATWVVGPLVLAVIIALGPRAGAPAWALWCVSTSVVTLIQPAVAQKFPSHRAGRALSAFNLVIFLGVFVNQWAIGLAIDALAAIGLDTVTRFRVAFALFLLGTVWAGVWYRRCDVRRHASPQPSGR
jgi:predicted MFS family arabinose efflux permease